MKKYWLYLDSYVALSKDSRGVVIYNMLQKKGVRTEISEVLNGLVEELLKEDNLYCIAVDDDILLDSACRKFIRALQENFSGGLIEKRFTGVKPVNFPPVLNLQKERQEIGRKEYVLGYLFEVNIYLTLGDFIYNEPVKTDFSQYKGQRLAFSHIEKLIEQLKAANVMRINLFGELPENEQLDVLMRELSLISCRKTYFLPLPQVDKLPALKKQLENVEIDLKMLVNMNCESDVLGSLSALKGMDDSVAEILFYVTSLKEVEKVEEITEGLDISSYALRPLYTGNNLDFFKEVVYLSEEDILSSDCERREILAHTVLNTHNFGKLSLLPGGDVYAGLNFPSIGNIGATSLNQLISCELSEEKAWLRTRNQAPCNVCAYRCLCPSPSGYEDVIGKENLCHIMQ